MRGVKMATELPPGAEALDLGQAVLACLLLEGGSTVRAHPIRVEAFYTDLQRALYTVMLVLAARGDPVDAVSLVDELRSAGQLDAVGGPAAIAALVQNPLAACIPAHLDDYIARLEAHHTKREVLAGALRLGEHAQNGYGAAALVAEVEALAATLRGPASGREPAPLVTVEGDELRVEWPTRDVQMNFARARDSSDGPHAEMRVTRAGRLLHFARVALLSSSARDTLVRTLDRQAPGPPWRDMLEAAVEATISELRRGGPIIEVIPRPRDPGRVLLEGFLTAGEPLLLFADGGSGKGYIALAGALALMTGRALGPFRPTRGGVRVAYLDWEADEPEIAGRLEALERGAGLRVPPGHFFYRQMARPLAEDGPAVRAMVSRGRIDVLVTDSAGPAAQLEPEGAEAAFRIFAMLRSQGATPWVLTHISKAGADAATANPYGSTFWKNLARSVWELRRSAESDTPAVLTIAAFHRKMNSGPLARPWSVHFTFASDGAVSIADADLRDTPDLMRYGTLPPRILAALCDGAQTSKDLAERLGVAFETLDRTCRRLRKSGSVVGLPDTRPTQWGLPAHA